MYTFNDKMYYYVLKPTAQGFAFVLPRPSRVCLANAFYNLSMPIRALRTGKPIKIKLNTTA